jgi:hypothetical protein
MQHADALACEGIVVGFSCTRRMHCRMLKGSAFGALDCIDGMHDDDEAHAQLVQQDRVEVCAEAAPPAVVTPLASWLDLGRLLAEGVADDELARHDGMEGAVELAGVVGVVQRNQSSSAIALWSFVGVSNSTSKG